MVDDHAHEPAAGPAASVNLPGVSSPTRPCLPAAWPANAPHAQPSPQSPPVRVPPRSPDRPSPRPRRLAAAPSAPGESAGTPPPAPPPRGRAATPERLNLPGPPSPGTPPHAGAAPTPPGAPPTRPQPEQQRPMPSLGPTARQAPRRPAAGRSPSPPSQPLHALPRGQLPRLKQAHHRRHPGTSTGDTTRRPDPCGAKPSSAAAAPCPTAAPAAGCWLDFCAE